MVEEQQFSNTPQESVPWKIIIFVLVLILVIGGIFFLLKNKKPEHTKKVSTPNSINSLTPTVIEYNCRFETALCAKPPCPTIEVCSNKK